MIKKVFYKTALLFSAVIQACGQNTTRTEDPSVPDPLAPIEVISSRIVKSGYKGTEYPTCFEAAFADSTFVKEVTTVDSTTFCFQTFELGKINIESGKIIACDPAFGFDAIPFTQTFPTGQFNLELSIAKIPNNNRVAYSRVVFSNEPVSEWIYATRKGEKQIPVNDSVVYCFSVDGGQGMFIDSLANLELEKVGQPGWFKVFADNKWFSPDFYGCIHNFGRHNLGAFYTGYGDGCYGCYIGLDRNGNICRLLTDFGFVMWWKKQ